MDSISQNSLQLSDTPYPPRNLVEMFQHLDSIFYNIDYAELKKWYLDHIENRRRLRFQTVQLSRLYSIFKDLYYSL